MEDLSERRLQEQILQLEKEIRLLRAETAERNRLKEQLLQAQKMESLANLSAGIAHDFNNILQSVLGYTQVALFRRDEDSEDTETFQQIEKIIRKGSKLTQQLLTIGRKTESKFAPMDLNLKIRHVRQILQRTIPRMIDIELDLSDGLAPVIADEGQVDQVLMNLGINARNAMPEGGKLIFKTENVVLGEHHPLARLHDAPPGAYVLLTTSDTGCGMSRETLKCIFEPFFTTKKSGEGTGLGLSMVYAIVKKHHGLIDCASTLGEGTTFRIYLPALGGPNAPTFAEATKNKNRFVGGNETILLVDDEEDILNVGKSMLEKHGYSVVLARNGEEAVQRCTVESFDLVILDLGMPGMGGIKCLQQILSENPDAKILISSGYALNGRVGKALKTGARNYLPKPYRAKEMLEMVRKVLDEKPEE